MLIKRLISATRTIGQRAHRADTVFCIRGLEQAPELDSHQHLLLAEMRRPALCRGTVIEAGNSRSRFRARDVRTSRPLDLSLAT